MIRIGVIGYGYWGPNIVRNLRGLEGCHVAGVCDQNSKALKRVSQAHPDLAVTTQSSDLLTSPDIDAIAVVTPVCAHFDLAKAALENGKHVFMEKPFTSTTRQAEELIELAERKSLRIMVDHTFLFTGAVRKIRELIDEGVLGDLYYYDSMLVWNDLEADEKIKIYDKGVQMASGQGLYELMVSYRSGDMWAPRVEQAEALKVELGYFIECVTKGQTPINDGVAGLRVIKLLEAADRSLAERGRAVQL